ncbi:MAG: hypothetical protein LBU37_00180 [Tannerellaceae bacterium]|jgi:hypothetical protein|nr:hypothetical protein [Tannerellaceae bacterium]
MKENLINYQFLYSLTNTGHYELHQFIHRVIEMCKDDIPPIVSMWNIYDLLLRQEEYFYKWKENASAQKTGIPNNTNNLLINYQLAYIRQKVDNVLLNILILINTPPVETYELAPQTRETYEAILSLIDSYLIKAKWEHAPNKYYGEVS